MDLMPLSLNIKVFEFEFSLSFFEDSHYLKNNLFSLKIRQKREKREGEEERLG